MRSFLTFVVLVTAYTLAFGQEYVTKRLNESPRHHEWVEVKEDENVIHSFLVYPEVKDKAPAVLVIHENRGLTDWVRSVTDQLAEIGYIAIAPDLLSGKGPDGGKTSDFSDRNSARDALYAIPQDQITANLNAVFEHVAGLPACNGSVAVAGFCWGGRQSFLMAANQTKLSAAFVFYGTPPDSEAMGKINCPVYGFYGGNDNRVTSTVPETVELMKKAGKMYEPVTYEGGRHGFMRAGEAPDASEANKKAQADGWSRWKTLLKKTFALDMSEK